MFPAGSTMIIQLKSGFVK